jgi:integrase/recombinase XerD
MNTVTVLDPSRAGAPAHEAMPIVFAPPVQASSDDQLMALWLHGRSACTQRAYLSDVRGFLAFVGIELRLVTLGHVQAFADSLKGRADKSQARTIAAVRSLLTFAHKVGYVSFNVGAAMRQPKVKNTLAQRIMAEADTLRMLALENNPRNRALLFFLYDAGARVSEAVGLTWADVRPDGNSAVVTLLGKGGKTRFNRLAVTTWKYLQAIQSADAKGSDAVFASRKGGGALDPSMVDRIVRTAAVRAGIDAAVSAHWLRHAHASHAMNRGAKLHEITAQLGHSSAAVTSMYLHVNPEESSSRYLAI